MSTLENDIYLDSKEEEFREILANKDWPKVDELYQKMEADGMGQYVPELSQLMTEEDVREYKTWDRTVNGDTETQMDDDSDNYPQRVFMD